MTIIQVAYKFALNYIEGISSLFQRRYEQSMKHKKRNKIERKKIQKKNI